MNNYTKKIKQRIHPNITYIASLILLFILETAIIFIIFYLTFIIRSLLIHIFDIPIFDYYHSGKKGFLDFLQFNYWIIILFIGTLMSFSLYFKNQTFWDEWVKIIKVTILTVILSFTVISLLHTQQYASRLFIILFGILNALVIPIFRYIIKIIFRKVGLLNKKFIYIGDTNRFQILQDILKTNKYLGMVINYNYTLTEYNTFKELQSYAAKISKLCIQNNATGVIIQTQYIGKENIELLAELLHFYGIEVLLYPLHISYKISGADTYHLMYENYFLIRLPKGLYSLHARIIKRIIDILLGIIALVLLAPLLVFTAVLTFIGDGFPIIYKSKRFGYKGILFDFYKFRYMRKDTSFNPQLEQKVLTELFAKRPDLAQIWKEYKKIPLEDDPRIIPKTGRIMAKLDLPELAQIINVIQGKMSLVGPRPYLPRERGDMGDYFWRVTSVKPGITGLWQVLGGNNRTFKERLEIDTWYIHNWSLWLDIIIMLKTILLILRAIIKKFNTTTLN